MAKEIIINKPGDKHYRLSPSKEKDIIINPPSGGGGGKGVQFSVEEGHILVLSGNVSVENNDTIVL